MGMCAQSNFLEGERLGRPLGQAPLTLFFSLCYLDICPWDFVAAVCSRSKCNLKRIRLLSECQTGRLNLIVPASRALSCTQGCIAAAANAVAVGSIQVWSDVVTAEDCCFPSFDKMLIHPAPLCLYVWNKDVF